MREDTLGEVEVERIKEVLGPALQGLEVRALCCYGSRIAGYAKQDSDYDVIVVAKDYRQRIRYRYLSGPVEVSALVVDEEALRRDAIRASLGEFVIGRLLNIYIPLYGEELLRELEILYKKRVMLELLRELSADLGDFLEELRIEIDYFLFEKLRRRAEVYPPALYSYAKTYSGPLAKRNLAQTREGFLKAAEELEEEGLLMLEGDSVRVIKEMAKRRLAKVSSLMVMAGRGLKAYAVHGYAGRVGFNVVAKETLSKLRRGGEIGEIPPELKDPRSCWRLPEGRLLGAKDWAQELLDCLSFGSNCRIRKEPLGEPYSTSRLWIISEDDGREEKVVVKNFKDLWSVKWAALNLLALASRRFSMTPLARLTREYWAIRNLRSFGFKTPLIVGLALDDRVLITSYIEGPDLAKVASRVLSQEDADTKPIELYGELLAKLHAHGLSLGDAKPNNAIFKDGVIYLTDLEQVAEGGDEAWDVAEFLYYSTKMSLNIEGAKRLARSFLDGYLKEGDVKVIERARGLRYLSLFQPIASPLVLKAIRDEMKRVLS